MAPVPTLCYIELLAAWRWHQSLHPVLLHCLQFGGGPSPYIKFYWIACSLVVAPVPTLSILLGWLPLQWLIYWFLVLHSDGPTANHGTSMTGSITGFWIPWLGIAMLYMSSAIQALGGGPSPYIKLYWIAYSLVVAPVPTLRLLLGWLPLQLVLYWFLVLHSDDPTANHCTSMTGSVTGVWIPWLGIAVLYMSSAIQALGDGPSPYSKLYCIACSLVVAPVPTLSSNELPAAWWWLQPLT